VVSVSLRYNIGHIGISLGDLGLAYQAFKVAVVVDPQHAEALNNIAVLEMRRQLASGGAWGVPPQSASLDAARACLSASAQSNSYLFEPLYNHGKFTTLLRRSFVRSCSTR
jgi:tetratricopeptide repeat protein 8